MNPTRLRLISDSADTGDTHGGFDAAGAVERPPIDVTAEATASIAHRLIRVIDEAGHAVGQWAPTNLTMADLITGLRDMLLVRAFDRTMWRSHRQGKSSFYMTCLGEEAIACAHRRELMSDDMTFPTYRQQGLLITAGYPIVDMMNQVLSNSGDPTHGRQLPVFYTSRHHGFFSISGNLGTQFVQAVGWAMAAALTGDNRIASAWIGEGATAESDFHSALVFASSYEPPVILNIVNNQWAISTHQSVALGRARAFAERGLGFGIPSLRVDGNDYLAVRAASAWAAQRVRAGHGPCLIEWVTNRAGAHSTSDDPTAYRPKDQPETWPLGDPVDRLSQHLRGVHSWSEADEQAMRRDVDDEIERAFAVADSLGNVKSGPWAPASSMFDDVYAAPPALLLAQRSQADV